MHVTGGFARPIFSRFPCSSELRCPVPLFPVPLFPVPLFPVSTVPGFLCSGVPLFLASRVPGLARRAFRLFFASGSGNRIPAPGFGGGDAWEVVLPGGFERARGVLFLGLQACRPAQPFPDADDVIVARAEPFVGVVIGVACLVQRRADPFERTGEGHQLFVEFQPACGDVPGVLVLVVVFPQVGDQFEQGEKVRRRRDDDLLVVGVRPDGRVVLQCGEEGRFVGDEHDDEVGRVEQALVLLASQFVDVLADGGRVGASLLRKADDFLSGEWRFDFVIAI